jgi:hypothetical protein
VWNEVAKAQQLGVKLRLEMPPRMNHHMLRYLRQSRVSPHRRDGGYLGQAKGEMDWASSNQKKSGPKAALYLRWLAWPGRRERETLILARPAVRHESNPAEAEDHHRPCRGLWHARGDGETGHSCVDIGVLNVLAESVVVDVAGKIHVAVLGRRVGERSGERERDAAVVGRHRSSTGLRSTTRKTVRG